MKFECKENEFVVCTAGLSYFMVYPNGDIYRCMQKYREKRGPLFNCRDFSKSKLIDLDKKCYEKTCEPSCDRDWASKWILRDRGNGELNVVSHFKSGELDSRFGAQEFNKMTDSKVHIIWSPTLICNYRCEYCGCVSSKEKTKEMHPSSFPEMSSEEWISFFEKIKNEYDGGVVTLSGGEPFLREKILTDVVSRLQNYFLFAITTNLSIPILNFVKKVSPKNVDFNLSIHPTDNKFNFEIFLGRVLLLKNKGFDVKVNFVAYPEQMYLYDEYKERFGKHEVKVDMIPCIGVNRDGRVPFSYTIQEKKYIDDRSASFARIVENVDENVSENNKEENKREKTEHSVSLPSKKNEIFVFESFDPGEDGVILYYMNKNEDPIAALVKLKDGLHLNYHVPSTNSWSRKKLDIGLSKNTIFEVSGNDIKIDSIGLFGLINENRIKNDIEDKSLYVVNTDKKRPENEPNMTRLVLKNTKTLFPSVSSVKNLIGAFYYIWYFDEKWKENSARHKRFGACPEKGWYNSLNRETIKNHINKAKESGIDFFVSSFNGDYNFEGLDILNRSCLTNDFKYCIHYETVNIFPDPVKFYGELKEELLRHMGCIIDKYMSSDSYLKIDGKPVLFIYTSRRILGTLGEINEIRCLVKNKMGCEPIIIGDEIWWDDELWMGDTKRLSKFDYIYSYNMYTPSGTNGNNMFTGKDYLNLIEPVYKDFYEKCKGLGVGLIPNIMPRYNDEFIRKVEGHYPLPPNGTQFYEDYFEMAKKYFLGDKRILLVTSFNEWYEDTQIEPCICSGEGDEYDGNPGYGDSFLKKTAEFKKRLVDENARKMDHKE